MDVNGTRRNEWCYESMVWKGWEHDLHTRHCSHASYIKLRESNVFSHVYLSACLSVHMENTIYIHAIVRLSSYIKLREGNVFSRFCLSVCSQGEHALQTGNQFLTIIITWQQNCEKVIFSVVSVCLSVYSQGQGVQCDNYPWCTRPHHPWSPHPPKKICTPPSPACSNLFIMKYVRLVSGQVASYWNASLFSMCPKNCQIMLRVRQKGEICNWLSIHGKTLKKSKEWNMMIHTKVNTCEK